MQPKLQDIQKWADRLAKALALGRDKYILERKDASELKDLLDYLVQREEYGTI